jgi:outer membrane protein TolC
VVNASTLVFALALATSAAPARTSSAAALPLDLDRVAALALERAPGVDAADARAHAAERLASSVAWRRLPALELSLTYDRLSSIPERLRSFEGFAFPQLLDTYGARALAAVPISNVLLVISAELRAAERDADAAAIEARLARREQALEARVAWLEWARAASRLDARRARQTSAARDVADTSARRAAGVEAAGTATLLAGALEAATLAVASAETELAQAERTLRRLLPAHATDAPLGAADLDALVANPPIAREVCAAPTMLDTQAAAPQLTAIARRAEAAEARADALTRAALPRLSVVGALDVGAPNPRALTASTLEPIVAWSLGARLEWSLGALPERLAAADAAEAEATSATHALARARRSLEIERASLSAALCATPRLLAAATARHAHAERLVALRRAELAAGASTPREITLAEAELAEAREQRVEVAVGHGLAVARLRFVADDVASSASGEL